MEGGRQPGGPRKGVAASGGLAAWGVSQACHVGDGVGGVGLARWGGAVRGVAAQACGGRLPLPRLSPDAKGERSRGERVRSGASERPVAVGRRGVAKPAVSAGTATAISAGRWGGGAVPARGSAEACTSLTNVEFVTKNTQYHSLDNYR